MPLTAVKRATFFVPLLLIFGALRADPPSGPHTVVIFHTNDLHGRVYPQKANWIKENPPDVGGFAALAATIRRERAKEFEAGRTVFLVDAGDWFQGTPEGDIPRGRLVVEWMNLVGYDLATVGNHEFDKGQDLVADLARLANFPFLGANIRRANGKRPWWVDGSRTYDVAGAKLMFVGLISSDMKSLVMPETIVGLTFEEEAKTLGWYVERFKDRIVIPVTHCGRPKDEELAKKFAVPAIVGGHSHSGIPNPKPAENGCLVCQCYAWGSVLGRIELTLENGRVVKSSAGHIPVRPSDGEDPETKALISRYAREIDATMNVVVGEAAEAMARNANGSSPLGNWVCDVMRGKSRAHVAFHNRTGIRADLDPGPIKLREMYEISPFSNTIVTFDLSGAELDSVLEFSIGMATTFLEVSGLECEVDPKAEAGARVTVLQVAAEPWDATRTYRVATNNFLAKGGDGHLTFKDGKNYSETGVDLLDAQVEACKAGPVKADATLRVRYK